MNTISLFGFILVLGIVVDDAIIIGESIYTKIRADGHNLDTGDILLRTEGQVYTGQEFGDLVLRTFPDGTRLTLGDIANIQDGFVETNGYARYMGRPSASMRVMAIGQQNELKTAAAVKEYVKEKQESMPAKFHSSSDHIDGQWRSRRVCAERNRA